MSDMISRAAAASEFADWYGFNYQSQSYYKWLKSVPTVNPRTCDTLEYLETAYTGARACDDVAEQVRLARAIAAYKQDVHEDCTVLDKIRAEIETEKNAGCHTWYAGGLDFAMSIIDKYKAERSGTDAKENINPYKKCKTCGQDKASCCGCPEVLELERRIRKEHKEC